MSLHGYVRTGGPSFDRTQRYCRVNVLRARFAAADSRDRGRRRGSRGPCPRGGRRKPVRRLRSPAGGAERQRRCHPARRQGLYRFYEELALRFAERGISAVAIDYFGRTAGVEKRGDDFDYMTHVDQTTPEGVKADVRAAVEHLRPPVKAVFTVGFCFGGRFSWHSAADGHGLAGAVGFYGAPRGGESPGALQRAGEMECPILALQAGPTRTSRRRTTRPSSRPSPRPASSTSS